MFEALKKTIGVCLIGIGSGYCLCYYFQLQDGYL